MQLTSLAAPALLAQNAAAQFNMLRFACSQLVVDRIDPLVNPGMQYTPHLHQFAGGNSLNLTMDPATHDLAASSCTSCSFKEDKSNYWTAVMFYKSTNGTYKRVPQVGNGGPQGQLINNGGLDVYYIPSGTVTAFKKVIKHLEEHLGALFDLMQGFRMLAGSATQTDPNKVTKTNICHRCWTSTSEDNFIGGAPCTDSDTVDIPTDKTCKMIRQTIIFPTCWDGTNLDSPDHQSHVAYSAGSGANGGGACPSTHPVKLPQIMYELMWNVTEFTNDATFPTDGSNPYVYSMNMGGSAAHGDYLFGWGGDTLQKAMDNSCNLNTDCAAAGIHAQAPAEYNACTIEQQAPEDVDGWLAALPMGEMAIKA
ncbi:Uu.00g135610.m01.CDS01 [Anthostomella pinea]|uniref:Uu.00g135610.m01.CDS01 n=1 Tax=Anthostomella pinea TaxID=933095 RepID=A0AAI8YII5_9PEZI|nr:Uu.00g135610.m01.CDS01 [Anthostomella pinea]